MTLFVLLLVAQGAPAAGNVSQGAQVFARSCAVGYCHGSAGAAGRAPRIEGRTFSRDYLYRVTREGVPGTAMVGWKNTLKPEEIDSVVAYMVSLSAGEAKSVQTPAAQGAAPSAPAKVDAPPQAERGRALFFDATRGTRCGTCHALEDWGVAVGPNLAASAVESASEIRALRGTNVGTAKLANSQQFPALVVTRENNQVRLYDLSVAPPVLRFLEPSEVTFESGSMWRHASVVAAYGDRELEDIAAYLRWLRAR